MNLDPANHSSHVGLNTHKANVTQHVGRPWGNRKVTIVDPVNSHFSGSTILFKSVKQRGVVAVDNKAAGDNILFGTKKVANHPKQGLPEGLIEKMVDLATLRGSVIASRHVEPIAKQLLREGYPTKHFNIKGKSANWGLQAGTIPKDQALSKKAGSNDIAKLNKDIEKCLKSKNQHVFLSGIKAQSALHNKLSTKVKYDAITVQLTISDERLHELNRQGMFESMEKTENRDEWVISVRERNDPNAPLHTQVARRSKNGTLAVYHLDKNGKEHPIEVLAHVPQNPNEQPMPFTADLDLLFEAVPITDVDFGHKDRMPNPRVSPDSVLKTAKHYRNKPNEKLLNDDFLNNEKPGIGNASKRTEHLIHQSKEVLKRHHPLIHHSTDAGNPASKETDNYPVTLFFPRSLALGFDTAMVFDESELKHIIELLHSKDFYVPQNPLWKTQHKRPSFSEAQEAWKTQEDGFGKN